MADIVNLATGLSRLRGNKKMYRRMLGLFLDSNDNKKLEEALSAGDIAAAEAAAHTIKGVAGNLSLDRLFEDSSTLMNELRAGEANPLTLAAFRESFRITVDEVGKVAAQLDTEI